MSNYVHPLARVTPEQFREWYGARLGPIAELLIANVIVGNFTWHVVCLMADAMIKKFDRDKQTFDANVAIRKAEIDATWLGLL